MLQVTKHIVGQSLFQLGVMYGLVVYGDQLFGIANGHTVQGPSQHYTIVFNTFVLMQLFNQVDADLNSLVFNAFDSMQLLNQMSADLLSACCDLLPADCLSTHLFSCSCSVDVNLLPSWPVVTLWLSFVLL